MSAAIERARRSLDGLSVGDAFGERFFGHPDRILPMIEQRGLPAGPWGYTDDSVMAMSIVDVLAEVGTVDQDRLAELFAARYARDPYRGYGGTADVLLDAMARGASWRDVAWCAFGGEGSMGNGGAMRAAPIGGYFAGDLARAAVEARRSAEVTHAHPEGQAGAIAVAVAAAWVAAGGTAPRDLFEAVLQHTPPGATRDGIVLAAGIPAGSPMREVAERVGNGSGVIAPDTVPLTMWCAATHLGRYEEAMWQTVAALGDRDTTCAIVGGIVALHPDAVIPTEWLSAREALEVMALAG